MELFKERKAWRLINQTHSILKESPLISFAIDDTLCEAVGQLQSAPVIRTWVHEASVVLGIQDHRLPFLQQGMAYLNANQYQPIVRNSGGLAVVLDAGILNLSLILSEQQEKLSIDKGYDYMVELVRALFPDVSEEIKAYEIVGSYCPGSYDLSINGKKFAGISQRRIKQGIAVQIYICIEGSGAARAKLIQAFYEQAKQHVETKFTYPTIQPNVMASMSELLGVAITVEDVIQRIRELLNEQGDVEETTQLNDHEQDRFAFYYDRIIERNKKMLYEGD